MSETVLELVEDMDMLDITSGNIVDGNAESASPRFRVKCARPPL